MPRGDAPPDRVRECALALFARHGVAGTSLQMIAAELGVTKAAVYYRFRTKEAIVAAVLAPAFDGFVTLLDEVQALAPDERPARLVEGLARRAVENRELYAVVLGDVTVGQMRGSPRDAETFALLRDTLVGPGADHGRLVRAAIFLSGLMGPAVDPAVASLDDAELQAAIIDAGRDILGLGQAAGV